MNGASGHVPPRRLEQVERAAGVDVEVVEGPILGEVVRRLGGAVDEQVRALAGRTTSAIAARSRMSRS